MSKPLTFSSCEIGDVVRCRLGLVKLTGRAQGGYRYRFYVTGEGVDNKLGPYWASPYEQVHEVVEHGQERYRRGDVADSDPVRGA